MRFRDDTSNSASLRIDPETGSPSDFPQPLPPLLASVEHTPVSGSTNSTLRAASQSPTSAATTERTCSYQVSVRNVGAEERVDIRPARSAVGGLRRSQTRSRSR